MCYVVGRGGSGVGGGPREGVSLGITGVADIILGVKNKRRVVCRV